MNELLNKYLDKNEKKEFLNIINPIISHEEFKRRMLKDFPHHGKISLSEHILEVAILTYKMCKKKKNVNLKLAVYIAMMHDLYTLPWQNNKIKEKYFSNKHGFRHPLESVINSINWYPQIYNDNDYKIIIDGIIHHMYPLPVRVFNNKKLELKNSELINNVDEKYINEIKNSSKRHRLFNLSLSKSKYKEGRIVSYCDKKVSIKQISNIYDLISLLTGRNKNLR